MQDILDKAKKIELVIFDVDGVMTDGSLFMGDDGQEYKAFNSLDGHGMRMLQEGGITAAIITGRKSNVVEHRMKDLGITRVYQGYRDKIPAYEALGPPLRGSSRVEPELTGIASAALLSVHSPPVAQLHPDLPSSTISA